MFLLVPAHLGCPGQIPQSRKTVVCVCVCVCVCVQYPSVTFQHVHIEFEVVFVIISINSLSSSFPFINQADMRKINYMKSPGYLNNLNCVNTTQQTPHYFLFLKTVPCLHRSGPNQFTDECVDSQLTVSYYVSHVALSCVCLMSVCLSVLSAYRPTLTDSPADSSDAASYTLWLKVCGPTQICFVPISTPCLKKSSTLYSCAYLR